MLLLFLDTETTGVELAKCQIIEIGAILYQLDESTFKLSKLQTFQSTISLRQKLEDRISRITGITESELQTAKGIVAVQKDWLGWLDVQIAKNGEIKAIVGHSIDFDLGFLKKEGWYLPTENTIDTLDLSKILYPNVSAVNLEYLAKKLEFEEDLNQGSITNMSHHRSLFDCIMCGNLFELILNKLQNIPYPQSFLDNISRDYLLKLPFYSQKQIQFGNPSKTNLPNEKLLSGELKYPSLAQRLEMLNIETLDQLIHALEWKWLPAQKLILMQIISCNVHRLSGYKYLKIHTQGLNYTALTLLDWCENKRELNSVTVVKNFERIIESLGYLLDNHCNLGEIASLIEIYQSLQPESIWLQKLLSQYHFLLIGVQTLVDKTTQNTGLILNLSQPLPKYRLVAQKLIQLVEDLKQIQWPIGDPKTESFLAIIRVKVGKLIQNLDIRSNKVQLRVGNGDLFFNCRKISFDLNKHLVGLTTDSQVQINLNQDYTTKLLKIIGVELDINQWQSPNQNYPLKTKNGIGAAEFLREKIKIAKEKKESVIIFCGLNSSLKKIEKTADSENLMKDVLIIGESGGVTKIASKLEQGFVGVVVVKFTASDFFAGQIKTKFAQVIIYDRPFFLMHTFWQTKAKQSSNPDEFLLAIKNIYLQGKVNSLYSSFQCPVEFVYNLI
jgi:DNA polymerase III epsilon subunit-like protein